MYSLHELLDRAALEEGEALQVRGGLEELRLIRVLVEYTQREEFNHIARIHNNNKSQQSTRLTVTI